MKFLIATCACLTLAGAAVAAPSPKRALILSAGQAVIYGGMTCTTYTGKVPNMVCVRNDLKGYGVVISQQQIIVAKQEGTKFAVVFRGKNS